MYMIFGFILTNIFSLGVAPLKPITHSKFAECIYNKSGFFIISYLHIYPNYEKNFIRIILKTSTYFNKDTWFCHLKHYIYSFFWRPHSLSPNCSKQKGVHASLESTSFGVPPSNTLQTRSRKAPLKGE
jgi:hypothetical protein